MTDNRAERLTELQLSTLDKRSEALLRIVPVALAGGGSVTQTTQIDEWLSILGKQNGVPIRRIGVAGPKADFVDEQVTGVVYPIDRAIQPAASVLDIYHNVCTTIKDEIDYLYSLGIRHITAVCCGYTSYGLFALKQAIEKINALNTDDLITGNIIIQDSSFPDVNALSAQLDERGYPLTRFDSSAYQSTQHVRIVFTLNGAVPFDVSLSKRCPDGCIPLMTAFPYTPRYLSSWQSRAQISKAEAKKQLELVLPGFTRVASSDWMIPLVASGGCWEEASVGKWMTREQYSTVEKGTLALVNALRSVSEQGRKRIVMPLIRQCADFVLAQQLPNVYSLEDGPSDSQTGLFILAYDTLLQPYFINLIASSDVIVHRTVQTNSFAETIFAQKPQLVMTIPAVGYMDAELMAQGLKQGLLAYDQDPREIAAEIYRILTEPEYCATLVRNLYEMFNGMCSQSDTNFGAVLAKAAGLNCQELEVELKADLVSVPEGNIRLG